MDIEQLQWEFKMLTSAEQHQFLEKHVEELREALGITHQMLIKNAVLDKIIKSKSKAGSHDYCR